MNEILQQRYMTDCIESTADVDEGPVTHIHFIYIFSIYTLSDLGKSSNLID